MGEDDLLKQAIALAQKNSEISSSLLQRRLRIGHPRAARLIEQMEDLGIIGPQQAAGRPRPVLRHHIDAAEITSSIDAPVYQSDWVLPSKDTRAQFVKEGFLSSKYYFQSGEVTSKAQLKSEEYQQLLCHQKEQPIAVLRSRTKGTWWMFKDEFYWDGEGYTAAEIEVLLLAQRMGREPFDQWVNWGLKWHEIEQRRKVLKQLQQQVDTLRRPGNRLTKQYQALTTLNKWIGAHIETGEPPKLRELKDQMLRLGFTSEDFQQIDTMPGVDFTGKTQTWINSQSAELKTITTQLDTLTTKMKTVTEEMEKAVAEAQAISEGITSKKPSDSSPGEREPIPEWLRRAVLARDDYICRYCGRRSQSIDVDHVVPVIQGGETTFENLVTACLKCNRKKGGRTPQEAGMTLLPPGTRQR